MLGRVTAPTLLHAVGELLEELALFPSEIDRRFHHHPAHEIPGAAAAAHVIQRPGIADSRLPDREAGLRIDAH